MKGHRLSQTAVSSGCLMVIVVVIVVVVIIGVAVIIVVVVVVAAAGSDNLSATTSEHGPGLSCAKCCPRFSARQIASSKAQRFG